MLKLSTKSSYGLRACLALCKAEGKLSSSEIAQEEGIPQRYLEQILAALRQGGLVESTRGAKGGYSLARPAGEITVAELVSCLEGALPPILCSMPEQRSETCRSQASGCSSSKLCCELEGSVMKVLASTTLAAMSGVRFAISDEVSGPAGELGSNISLKPQSGGDVVRSEHELAPHALPIANT